MQKVTSEGIMAQLRKELITGNTKVWIFRLRYLLKLKNDDIPRGKIFIHTFSVEVFVKYLANIITFKNGVVMADSAMHDLKMMTAEREYIKNIGRKGRGLSELLLPTFLCKSRDRLVVNEMG